MSTINDSPFDLALSVRDTDSHPLLLDFAGDALANILNQTDPDLRRKRLMLVPPKRQHYMSTDIITLINHMAGAPKGQCARFDSPSRIRAIFFLLKSAQCRLCARGREHEALFLRYLQSRSSFGLIGSSVTTAEEKHRKKIPWHRITGNGQGRPKPRSRYPLRNIWEGAPDFVDTCRGPEDGAGNRTIGRENPWRNHQRADGLRSILRLLRLPPSHRHPDSSNSWRDGKAGRHRQKHGQFIYHQGTFCVLGRH